MSKSSRKLRKEDRRLFYASRQVKFLLAWKELAAVADMLASIDFSLSREMHDLLTEFFEAVPTSPAARAEATRLSPPLSVAVERRRQAHIARLSQTVKKLQNHKDQGLVNSYKCDIERYKRPPGALLAAILAAHPQQPQEDAQIDAEQERIDQIAGELLSDLDLE